MRVTEENEKAGLKLNIHKTKIMASSPITSWQIELEKWKQWQILYSWVPKLLLAVIAAMKLKDTCSLEGKLWRTFVIQLLSVSDSLWSHGLQHTRFPILHYVPDFAQTHVHWVNDAIQSSHPLSPPSPPALSLSQHQGLFQWVGSLHQSTDDGQSIWPSRWSKYWSFSFSIRSSNEYSGLISFRIDWFDLLVVQGTL